MNALQLEDSNLTCDSSMWETQTNPAGQAYKVSPEWDVWEYNGNFYFTRKAAQREAKKQWKRIPTKEEWEQIMEEQDLTNTLPLAGLRNYAEGVFNYQGSYGYYWTASPGGSYVFLFSWHVEVDFASRSFGFSVRCLKNN